MGLLLSGSYLMYKLPLELYLYGVILIFGMVGNVLITLAIIINKKLLSVTNILLCNLAVSGFILSLVSLPTLFLSLVGTNYNSETLPNQFNCCSQFLIIIYQACTICIPLTSLAVCIHHFLSIYSSFSRFYMISKKNLRLIIFVLWIASLTYAITYLHFANNKQLYRSLPHTYPFLDLFIKDSIDRSINTVITILFAERIIEIMAVYILPFMLMIILYEVIIDKLERQANELNHCYQRYYRRQIRRAVKLLITCLMSMMSMTLPINYVLTLVALDFINLNTVIAIRLVFRWLSISIYVAIACNPILYAYQDTRIRVEVVKLLHLIWKKKCFKTPQKSIQKS